MYYIIAIVAGTFIGWLTNILAIEMLFRPQKSLVVFGKQLPFTPGLIPRHKKRMLAMVTKKTTRLFLDSFSSNQIDELSPQYKLFNQALDSHWASYIFLPPIKRKKLYKQLMIKMKEESQIRNSIEQMIQKQIDTYNIGELESTVKAIALSSLRGIKLIGAGAGAIVGLLTAIIGGL